MNLKRKLTTWALAAIFVMSNFSRHEQGPFAKISMAEAASSDYSRARDAFSGGDTAAATQILESMLFPSAKVSGKDLEEARKLLGVCYYLDGKRKDAERIFSQVLAANPRAKLRQEDLLDPNVEKVFEASRAHSATPRKQTEARPKQPASAAPRAAAPPRVAVSARKPAPKAVTGVFIQCKVQQARVFINDIYAGNVNQVIPLDPGKQRITVSYEGYDDASTTISLRPGQLQKFAVTLKKPAPPKPPPRPVAARSTKQNNLEQAARNPRNRQHDTDNREVALPTGRSNLADEFFRDRQTAGQPPQPVYQQPQPTYQQPQPAYQQPQPVYVAPQPVYQPPPVIVQQPQPVYVAPQPVYQSAPATYQSQYSAPKAASSPGRKKTKPRNMAIALLPLGAGQFQNADYVKGLIFGGAQIGGGVWGYMSYAKEKSFATQEAAALANDNPSDPKTLDDNFVPDAAKAYKNSLRMNQYIGWGVLALGWGIGVIDAIANIDTPIKRSASTDSDNPEAPLDSKAIPPRYALTIIPTDIGGLGLNLSVRF